MTSFRYKLQPIKNYNYATINIQIIVLNENLHFHKTAFVPSKTNADAYWSCL